MRMLTTQSREQLVMKKFSLLACISISLIFLLSGCRAKVGIDYSTNGSGELVVKLKPNSKINGLHDIFFEVNTGDRDSLVWQLEEGKTPVRYIVYGQLPPDAIQKYPADDMQPKPIPRGALLRVRVKYQFDSIFPPAACTGEDEVTLWVSEDGTVSERSDH